MDAGLNYLVRAKFIGWKEPGVLMRGSPGGIPQGTIWTMRYQDAVVNPWWDPLEKPPNLEVPDADEDDSVYEDTMLPEDEEEVVVLEKEDDVVEVKGNPHMDIRLAEVVAEDTDMRGLEDHIIDASPPYMPVGRGSMSKEDLVKRIKDMGGQANMSMRKAELQDQLDELNSSPQ